MDSSWNIGSIGIAGPPLRGPSSTRLIVEPPLSPPVSGPSPTASAQPLEPAAPLAAPMPPAAQTTFETQPATTSPRPASSLESLLIRFRLITSDQLDEALAEKRETGKDVGAIVVERGWVNEDQLARLLSYAPAFSHEAEPAEATATEPEPEPAAEHQPEAFEPETVEVEPAPFEPDTGAGPVIATAPELLPSEPVAEAASFDADAGEPAVEPAAVEPAPVHPFSHQLPPALELVEDEHALDVAPEPEPVAAIEQVDHSEPALELPEATTEPAHTGLAPPAADPFAEPEPAFGVFASSETSEPAPAFAAAPVAEAAPAVVEAAPALVEAAPAVVEAAPELAETAPEPQTVRFVEPAALETIARVFVRLSNGERVEAGSFDDIAAAKARAEEVVREVSNGAERWPFFGGRYIRPDIVVSVDLDATVVRYA